MLLNGKEIKEYASEMLVRDVLEAEGMDIEKERIAGVLLDRELRDLQTPIGTYRTLETVSIDTRLGWRIYRRSVTFLLIVAVHEWRSDAEVSVCFSANRGLFCDVQLPDGEFRPSMVQEIEQKMHDIAAERRPIEKLSIQREDAVRLFKDMRKIEKANLLSTLQQEQVSVYRCGAYYDYLYGAMLGNTGQLSSFALDAFASGLLLRTPDLRHGGKVPELLHQPKFSNVLAESRRWAKALRCDYVPDLNRANRNGEMGELIRVSEALHEKRIAEIADHIARHGREQRLILIAGPSSSGKTSFAQRLRVQLRVNGLEPVSISLDDYYRNRNENPINERGEYDYEHLEALDVKLFNEHMVELLAGRTIEPPTYNFVTGLREWGRKPAYSVRGDQPIIVEGIHGLNEKLSAAVPRENKYKIYISALTQLNIDSHNRIPTTDARLLRRLVRDYQFRGSQALKTLRQWRDVRAGEERNIFPFQEEADVMFNSALIYELGILKRYAVPLLRQISPETEEYTMARRLLSFCQYFDDITVEDEVPNNSILREFIGKSCFFS